jgi:hypothetical protein
MHRRTKAKDASNRSPGFFSQKNIPETPHFQKGALYHARNFKSEINKATL